MINNFIELYLMLAFLGIAFLILSIPAYIVLAMYEKREQKIKKAEREEEILMRAAQKELERKSWDSIIKVHDEV